MIGNFGRREALRFAGLGAALLTPTGRLLAQAGEARIPIEFNFWGPKKVFKQHPRVAIVTYPIRFIMAGEGNGGGRVGIVLTLNGPTEADMRALAQEARNDLAARLAAIGVQVVPVAEMLANPAFAAAPRVAGGAKWDEGTLDPMGKRWWFITGSNDAPLHPGWGSTTGASETRGLGDFNPASAALDAVNLFPNLTLEFSTITGSVNSGSKGSSFWTGGEVLFGFKPHSVGYYVGKQGAGGFHPKGRIVISPTRLPGELRTAVAQPSSALRDRLGNARIDEFAVNMTAWREWVRQAFRGYNTSMVQHIAAARA